MYDVTPIIFVTSYQIYIISPILLSWEENDYTWHIYEYVISYGLWMTKQPLYKTSHLLYLCNHTHLIDDIIAYVYTSGLLCSYEGHLRNLHDACQGNTDASQGEAGAPVPLSSCHSDIVIPINFQQESVIVTFWSIDLRVPLEVSKGCEASCPDKADIGLSLGSPLGIQTSLHLVRLKMRLHSSYCREIWASFKSGHLGVHSTWGTMSGSLSQTYCWGKPPLEVIVKNWHTSSVEARESSLTMRQYGVHGAFLKVLCWNRCSSRLQTGVSGNLWSCLKEIKPLVVYDGECIMPLEPMQWKWASSPVDF